MPTVSSENDENGSNTSFYKRSSFIACLAGLILISIAPHGFAQRHSATLYLFSCFCFFIFMSSISRFYSNEPSLYTRGIFSMQISFLIIISEIIMRFTGSATIFSIIALDLLNGYVFLRARKILVAIAQEIIARYKGRDQERRNFSLSIIVFGVLFIGLQALTIWHVIQSGAYFNPLIFAFCVLQVIAAYWGSIITRLGFAVYQGYEPEFAAREREKIQQLENVLMQRRPLAEAIAFKPPAERTAMIEAAFKELNTEPSIHVKSNLNALGIVMFAFGLGALIWASVSFNTEEMKASIMWVIIALIIFVITWLLLLREWKRYKETYVLVSQAGISFHEPDQVRHYLWVEFLRIDLGGIVRSASSPIAFYGYYKPRNFSISYTQYKTKALLAALRKMIDAPEIIALDTRIIDLRKFYITAEQSGNP